MERRTYLVTAGIGASSLLAGCLSDDPSDTESDSAGSDGDDETDPDGDESGTESEPDPGPVIETYLEAAQAENPDAMAEVVHSASPLQGLLTDPEWEFESSGSVDLDALETEVVTADGSIADVRELEGAEFWFAESDLEAEIGDEEITLVRAELDGEESTGETGVYALVTEDDEWKVFWVGSEDEISENPEETFEAEIIDTDDDVVERIEWDVDAVDAPEGSDFETGDYARVHLTDSPGLEADLIRTESTVAGAEFEFYGEDEDEPSTSWAGTWANVQLDPAGDQIVVTAVRGDTETVVHREQYEPSD
ncbi:hypothetical protein [Natrinema sp. DC36]|uniref:hypothetical protein n=1 Tax=Natrinema sp. DC36 TaxID=2878680 RepID=UPI001CF0B0C5|nr:hypothetical protein [Natrinema sp. DC36]